MNKMTKICLLSACLMAQQNYAINPKFLFYGYCAFLSSLLFVEGSSSMYKNKKPIQVANEPQVANEYQDINRNDWNGTSDKHNATENEHKQFLKEKLDDTLSYSDNFRTHRKNIVNEWNRANKLHVSRSTFDIHKKNIKALKDLTSLYPRITECLKIAIEDLQVTDKTYDICFEYALSQEKED